MTIAESTPTFADWFEQGGMQEAHMQPGEQSWASFKCDGGAHESETAESHPLITESVARLSVVNSIEKKIEARPQYEVTRSGPSRDTSEIKGMPVELVVSDLL